MSDELRAAAERAVEAYDMMTALLGPMGLTDGPILPLVEFARQQLAERERREKDKNEHGLLPCPFCGSKIVGRLLESTDANDKLGIVGCGVCGACGPSLFEGDELIIQWNARPAGMERKGG